MGKPKDAIKYDSNDGDGMQGPLNENSEFGFVCNQAELSMSSFGVDDEGIDEDEREDPDEDFYGNESSQGRKDRLKYDRSNRKLFKRLMKRDPEDSPVEIVEEILSDNQGMVRSAVNQAISQDSWFSDEDLMLEGNIGMLEAIARYKLDKGEFYDFAKPWVKGRIDEAKRNDPRTIRKNSGIGKDLLHLLDQFRKLKGKEPETDQQLLEFALDNDVRKKSGSSWSLESIKHARQNLAQARQARSIEEHREDDDVSASEEAAGQVEAEANDDGQFSINDLLGEELFGDDCEDGRIKLIGEAIEESGLGRRQQRELGLYLHFLACSCADPSNKDAFYRNNFISKFDPGDVYRDILEALKDQKLREALEKKGLLD